MVVQGMVKTVTKIGAVLQLPDGIQGVVMPHHFKGLPLKPDTEVHGMVLLVDVVNHCLELTLLSNIKARINNKQDGIIHGGVGVGVCLRGETMVTKPHQVLVSLKGSGRQQLASIPVRCHLNDFNPVTPLHKLGAVNKVVIQVVGGGMIIGLPKSLIKDVQKRKRRHQLKVQSKVVVKKENSDDDIVLENSVEEDNENLLDFEEKNSIGKKKAKKSKETLSDGQSFCLNEEESQTDLPVNKKKKKKTKTAELEISSNDIRTIGGDGTAELETKKSKHESSSMEDYSILENLENDILNSDVDLKEDGKSKSKKAKKSRNKDISDLANVETENTSIGEISLNEVSLLESDKKKRKKSKHKDSFQEQSSSLIIPESNLTDVSVAEEPNRKKSKKSMNKSITEDETLSFEKVNGDLDSDTKSNKRKSKKLNQRSSPEEESDAGPLNSSDEMKDKAKTEIKRQRLNSSQTKIELDSVLENREGCETNKTEDNAKMLKRKKRNSSSEEHVKESEKISNTEEKTPKRRVLSADIGFIWDAKPELLPAVAKLKKDSESSSDEDDDIESKMRKKKKLTPAEKRELARQEEKRLREVEQQLMDSERNPQSADDFDRLVLASPNNSLLWVKYMAFHLQATEIEKARAVAERALKTISFREEQEKLNVWVALLNLENLYGTKESLDKALQEAVQTNDAYKVYMQIMQIYAESGKIQEADKVTHLVTKKFRDKKDTWLQAGEILMKSKQLEKARSVMQKALGALDRKEHVEVIMKFALLENKYGEAERAQTLMENILTSYPKRVDVWSSYVDMLVKSGLLDIARQVLERAVVQKLPARKMKVLFKKFLQFEEQHGTLEGAEKVRQMAVEYVNSAANIEETEQTTAD